MASKLPSWPLTFQENRRCREQNSGQLPASLKSWKTTPSTRPSSTIKALFRAFYKKNLFKHPNGDLWELLYLILRQKSIIIVPVKSKSHVQDAATWVKYNMMHKKFVYNGLADHAAGEQAKQQVRTQAQQEQHAYYNETAYKVALRIAHIELRCWEFRAGA